MARERATVSEVVSGEVVFEVDRFEWTDDDRIEVTGRWYGLRGHRFVRPILTAEADDGPRRMLALLEHKPWAADDGEPWIAAFPWEGEQVEMTSIELAVAPSLAIDLPAPKAPGQRRKTTGSASRQARRGPAPPKRDEEPDPPSPPAPDELDALRAQLEGEQQTVRRLAAELDDAHARLDAASTPSPDVAALQRERDAAIAERDAAIGERDAAVTQRDDARARASLDRDAVTEERDEAVSARVAAQHERDEALDQRSAAQFEIKAALAERDAAVAERDRATEGHRAAVRDLEALQRRLQEAESRPPAAVELPPTEPPVRPSGPLRSLPREKSALVLWGQRLAALIVLVVWALVVYKVLHGVV
jgi:hypothetical protein